MNQSYLLGPFLLVSIAAATVYGQARIDSTLFGDWDGSISVQGMKLTIHTHFVEDRATIDIPQQGAQGLPLQNVSSDGDIVHFELPAGPGLAVFDGNMDGDTIAGTFSQAGANGSFTLARSGAAPTASQMDPDSGPEGEPVAVETSTGTLHGSLLVPETPGPWPMVVLVSGSGPTDRDGNTVGLPGKNNSLLLLAEALRENGIASIRYDKRGIGESVMPVAESDLRIDSFAVDAASWARLALADGRFSHVFLAGHSEGALLVSMAATKVDVAGVITIAGAGRPASALLKEQLAAQLPANLMTQADSIIASLLGGETVRDVPQPLMAIFRPSVQPYLISWFKRDPAQVLARVKRPKLIAQGETDIQVSVADAKRLAAASPDAKLSIIPGMNHVLKDVPADRAKQVASYSDPSLPVDATLVSEVARFVKEVTAGGQ